MVSGKVFSEKNIPPTTTDEVTEVLKDEGRIAAEATLSRPASQCSSANTGQRSDGSEERAREEGAQMKSASKEPSRKRQNEPWAPATAG